MYDAIRHLDALFDARDVGGEAAGDEREVLPEVAGGDVGALEGVNLATWQLGHRLVARIINLLDEYPKKQTAPLKENTTRFEHVNVPRGFLLVF